MAQSSTVKWFNMQKGFGFIVDPNGGEDLFVHFSGVVGNPLQEGDQVQYDSEYNEQKGKYQAVNVSGGTGQRFGGGGFGGKGKGGGKGFGKGGGFGGPQGGFGGPQGGFGGPQGGFGGPQGGFGGPQGGFGGPQGGYGGGFGGY